MNKKLDLQILNENIEKINAYPDDLACFTQTEAYIRDKYGVFGDDPEDIYRADFATKFLSFDAQTHKILFPYDEDPHYCPYAPFEKYDLNQVVPDLKRAILPKELIAFLESVTIFSLCNIRTSPTDMTPEQKQAVNDGISKCRLKLGLIVFAKMFSCVPSANTWHKLFSKEPEKSLQLLNDLLFLPHQLLDQYIKLCKTPYKQARDIHQVLEQFLHLHSFKGIGGTMLFSYYDFLKDRRGEPYDIPANKMDDRTIQQASEDIEEYYTELTKLLPTLCAENALSPEEQKLNNRMQKQNSTALHFWARYFCDTFIKIFDKPHYSCVATFISDIFDVMVTDNQINDLMRKE